MHIESHARVKVSEEPLDGFACDLLGRLTSATQCADPAKTVSEFAAEKQGYARTLGFPHALSTCATKVERVVQVLLNRHGRLYSEALGLDLRPGSASVLFQWLCASLLLGGRIRATAARQAAGALLRQGWTTAEKMAASTWEERTRLLNRSGYARYDESTSRRLGDMAQLLLDRYGGDLCNLREAARRAPQEERRLLKEFKGIGDVRADIFFREVQLVWDELYPFADRRALHAASDLGLGSDAQTLARLVDPPEFARLVAAIVRCDLGKHAAEILAEADM